MELRWDTSTLTVVVAGGQAQKVERAQARQTGGILGRYPDEVDALDDLLTGALQARLLGTEDGDAHYTFTSDSRRAARRGFPVELGEAFAQATRGQGPQLEAWIGADGLPRRLDYVVRLEPVRNAGKLVLPARTITVRYDLSALGESVETSG